MCPGNPVGITRPDETTLTVSVNPSLINVIPLEVTSQTSGLTPLKRARGKSVSIPASAVTPAHILRSPSITPTVPGTTDKILNNLASESSETSASVTLSQTLVLPRSPISPHLAKPRKGVFGEFSSECSESSPADSNLGGSSGDRICIVLPSDPCRNSAALSQKISLLQSVTQWRSQLDRRVREMSVNDFELG